MKNTKMRKKMLLSSIAMLMVATVSLGSATFAWFKSNPDASASGLKMKATASTGLKILSATDIKAGVGTMGKPETYKSSTYLRSDGGTATKDTSLALNPASIYATNDGYVGYTVGAALDTAYGAADETVSTATAVENNSTDENGDYYVEDIYAALVGAATPTATGKVTISGLTIETGSMEMKAGVRVALYYENWVDDGVTDFDPVTDGVQPGYRKTYIGTYAPSQRSNNMITGFQDESSTKYSNVKVQTLTAKAQDQAATWQGDDLDQTGKDRFKVIVYLDGEDNKVFSNGIRPQNIVTGITLDLHVEPNP